jgi:glycine cleavage system aminomethyltransferase T
MQGLWRRPESVRAGGSSNYRRAPDTHDVPGGARATLKKVVADPTAIDPEKFAFATIKPIDIAGKTVSAFRISYVGEQGWELHMNYEDGLAVWDALRETGVMAFGIETYANSRRMEKSLRLQNADLLTQYNLLEATLADRR